MSDVIKVKLSFEPRPWQLEFFRKIKRWNVLVIHRRAGKTVIAINVLQYYACRLPGGNFAYIAPFYNQAKNIAWKMLKQYAIEIPGVIFKEHETSVEYPNGSVIRLYGADNPDNMRGLGLDGVVFDEYSQQPSNIFTEIIRPALSDRKGWALWIGTPKGRNAFYDVYNDMRKRDNGYTMVLKASESKILDEEELKDARETMTEDEYNQEYECAWEASVKGAYYAKELSDARAQGRIIRKLYDAVLPVYTFWDIGMNDYTTIIFAQFVGNEIRIIDIYRDNNKALSFYLKYVSENNYNYKEHYFPHDMQARDYSANGMTRLDLARMVLGDSCRLIKTPNGQKKLGLIEGINYARTIFHKILFDEEKTIDLLDALGSYQQEWDDKAGLFKDQPLHNWASHYADAFRYLCVVHKYISGSSNGGGSVEVNYGLDPWNNEKDVFSVNYDKYL